ncbi:YebG family protein [Teredinibacter turnerae]|nr:YebG family protein [Teredinibacter turnerae]
MPVIAVWKCDRDGSMFDDKKAAEAHDNMLELAANITQLIESRISGISDENLEAIGLLLAKNSDALAKACKGKPSVLLELEEADTETTEDSSSKVTAING